VENKPVTLELTNDEADYLWHLLAGLRAKTLQPSQWPEHQTVVAIYRKLVKAAGKPENLKEE